MRPLPWLWPRACDRYGLLNLCAIDRREPHDCARALRYLVPVAEIGDWGGFRQHVGEMYVAGVTNEKVTSPDLMMRNTLLRELVQVRIPQQPICPRSDYSRATVRRHTDRPVSQGSELGYEGASTSLGWLLAAAAEQQFYEQVVASGGGLLGALRQAAPLAGN